MQCIIMENTLIKLTLHDETKKRAHDSQIVRAASPFCLLCDSVPGVNHIC